MNASESPSNPIPAEAWFVGAYYGTKGDQTARFLEGGIWENGYDHKYIDEVKSMKVGDRIAIKAAYVRKKGFDFDTRGNSVSVMSIKAIGTITSNHGDGRHVDVDWEVAEPNREWLFYTNLKTLWHVKSGDWASDALLDFTFNGAEQDVDFFRNTEFWFDRFGDDDPEFSKYAWTDFYEEVSSGLLEYKDDRESLLEALFDMAASLKVTKLVDKFSDGTEGPLRDICPFTVLGTFNRGTTNTNRVAVAAAIGEFLDVEEEVPNEFNGIPVLNNMTSMFFAHERARKPDDIDALWNVFEAGITWADEPSDEARQAFIVAFDIAMNVKQASWNVTFGLYWARPWSFVSLDWNTRQTIVNEFDVGIAPSSWKYAITGTQYVELMESLADQFDDDTCLVHSLPALVDRAWQVHNEAPDSAAEAHVDPVAGGSLEYSIENIIDDGCFLKRADIEQALARLSTKKNLILQGPPGTGKTWLARRLAYALSGRKGGDHVVTVQFHPNMSYEDFVLGYRPSSTDTGSTLELVKGTLMQMVERAKAAPDVRHVIVIEEINRGNPAQVFGEVLTLLETDKRSPADAIRLSYQRQDDDPVYLPENLYIVGTMNIADRSLSLVDLALRRRFAFVELKPCLDERWRSWVVEQSNVPASMADSIRQRLGSLNDDIVSDPSLGRQFRVGHSYVTPTPETVTANPNGWFREVVETEIGPLLDEYWFDRPDRAEEARTKLVEGL